MTLFFEVVFWAFFNFRRVYTGQYYVSASQNWFGERYGINWKKSQFLFLLHTCGTTYDQQSEIVDFLLNFDVSENFRYVPDVCEKIWENVGKSFSSMCTLVDNTGMLSFFVIICIQSFKFWKVPFWAFPPKHAVLQQEFSWFFHQKIYDVCRGLQTSLKSCILRFICFLLKNNNF